jgi:hypothetical protein
MINIISIDINEVNPSNVYESIGQINKIFGNIIGEKIKIISYNTNFIDYNIVKIRVGIRRK